MDGNTGRAYDGKDMEKYAEGARQTDMGAGFTESWARGAIWNQLSDEDQGFGLANLTLAAMLVFLTSV